MADSNPSKIGLPQKNKIQRLLESTKTSHRKQSAVQPVQATISPGTFSHGGQRMWKMLNTDEEDEN